MSDSKPVFQPRSSVAYLSTPNMRKILWLVRSLNKSKTKMDVPDTSDSVVNRVLDGFFSKNYPEMDEFLKARDKIDNDAVEALVGKHEKTS